MLRGLLCLVSSSFSHTSIFFFKYVSKQIFKTWSNILSVNLGSLVAAPFNRVISGFYVFSNSLLHVAIDVDQKINSFSLGLLLLEFPLLVPLTILCIALYNGFIVVHLKCNCSSNHVLCARYACHFRQKV